MTGHDSDDIEYLDRDAGLYWFDHAAWIAGARIRCPHWYSAHASDFVDVLCWAFAEWHQNPENPDATTPTTSEEEEDTAPETEQTTLVTDGGQCKDGTDRGGQVKWYYGIDHSQAFETRHEAVGEAAIINRGRDDRRRDVTVWAYPECECNEAVVTLDHEHCCARCGAVIA